MYKYPVEKHILRFYKYKFMGYDEPIVVEAYNKQEARALLRQHVFDHPELHHVKVVSESLSLPIFGETIKNINGVDFVWVGELSQDNWMPLEEFKKIKL